MTGPIWHRKSISRLCTSCSPADVAGSQIITWTLVNVKPQVTQANRCAAMKIMESKCTYTRHLVMASPLGWKPDDGRASQGAPSKANQGWLKVQKANEQFKGLHQCYKDCRNHTDQSNSVTLSTDLLKSMHGFSSKFINFLVNSTYWNHWNHWNVCSSVVHIVNGGLQDLSVQLGVAAWLRAAELSSFAFLGSTGYPDLHRLASTVPLPHRKETRCLWSYYENKAGALGKSLPKKWRTSKSRSCGSSTRSWSKSDSNCSYEKVIILTIANILIL